MHTRAPLVRVTEPDPCQACGKGDWCSRSADGAIALCMRVSEGSVRTAANGAYVHVLRHDPNRPPRVPTVTIAPRPADLRPIVDRACAATPTSWIRDLATRLGLPLPAGVEALHRLGVHRAHYDADAILRLAPRDARGADKLRWQCRSWLRCDDVAGFPLVRRGRVVGIRLRVTATSEKRSLSGGREGAFLPDGIAAGAPVWISEGPTDAAALLAVGLTAVGRASATGGADAVVELVRSLRPPAVVVVADNDPGDKQHVGQRGAAELALRLALLVQDVRVCLPPDGTKDSRAAVIAGARRSDFERAAAMARPVGNTP